MAKTFLLSFKKENIGPPKCPILFLLLIESVAYKGLYRLSHTWKISDSPGKRKKSKKRHMAHVTWGHIYTLHVFLLFTFVLLMQTSLASGAGLEGRKFRGLCAWGGEIRRSVFLDFLKIIY